MLPALRTSHSFARLSPKARKQRQELLVQQRKDLEARMTPELRALAEKLQGHIDDGKKRNFRSSWERGGDISAAIDPKNVKKFGPAPLSMLASKLDYSESSLLKFVHFHEDFTEKQLVQLCTRQIKGASNLISWAHIEVLLTVEDIKNRQKLLDEVYTENLTPDDLYDLHKKMIGFTPGKAGRHKGGRPVKVGTLSSRLEGFHKVCHVMTRNEAVIWRNPEFGFLISIEELPADKLTPTIIKKIEEDVSMADKAMSSMTAVKGELEQALEVARRRAEAQAKTTAATESEAAQSNGHSGRKRSTVTANA